MLNQLSFSAFCVLTIITSCVAAQSGEGSSSSKGVFLDDGQQTGGGGSALTFSFGLNGASFNATSGRSRLEYIESKTNDWGATALYDGARSSGQFKVILLYISNLSADSDGCIEYDISTKSSTEHPRELYVKQILNNDKGKPLAAVTFDTKVSDQEVKLKHSKGEESVYDLSNGNILVIDENGNVEQTDLPENLKAKPTVFEAIRILVEQQKTWRTKP